MPQEQSPQEQEQTQDQIIDEELDDASLENVSGGLSSALDNSGNTTNPASISPQLNKNVVKSFQCDFIGKS